jgi:UDP-N-acetylmuramoylalanine--D-glutamate ligase
MAVVSIASPRVVTSWMGRRVTLMGLGRHGGGLGAARYLARQGARLTISDTADARLLADSLAKLAGLPVHALHLGGHRESDFREADVVVVNPAVRPDHPCLRLARARGATITSEIELFLRATPARVIGVTGSNGKSTTATLLAAMLGASPLRAWLGGNIGGSLLDDLPRMSCDDWVVLELSSFQLAHLSDDAPPCAIGVLTSIAPNHLDWHGSLEAYAAAKRRLLRSPDTLAVFDASDSALASLTQHRIRRVQPAWPLAEVPPLLVPGDHNRRNAALAAAAATAAGASRSAIVQTLRDFRGLEHRLQPVAEVDGRRYINDSKSTSPHAAMAALDAVAGPLWLLAGGTAKGAKFDDLAARIAGRARGAAVFGSARESLRAAIHSADAAFPVSSCETLAAAFAWCVERSRRGDAILLSPGCASHDQFVDFADRGRAFAALVRSLSAA